ncbi:MAG: hypothetical protein CL812_07510 [Confluentimicrobium sp.]|nr:hypothetical protein [Actibacterium sp.]
MITRIEDYFTRGCGRCDRFDGPDCSVHHWAAGLSALRQICLEAGLTETAKWGQPCYTHAGRNIAILGAFRENFCLTFFKAGLLDDPDRLLERAGPNTQTAGVLRFTEVEGPAERADAIRDFLHQLKHHAEAGTKPPRQTPRVDLPEDLVEALDDDPDLAAAFHALTPGRQRSYVITLSGAKKPETRARRILGFRERILSGRGATER